MTPIVTGSRRVALGAARSVPLARLLPTASLLVAMWLLAWREHGSIAAADWLPEAIFAALLLLVVLASGAAIVPERLGLWGGAGILGLAAWEAVSITRSPTPAGARDEALLTALYAVALAVPLLSLARARDRVAALVAVVAALTALALATAVKLVAAPSPGLFYGGRLNFPLSYVNACAAIFLLGFWPALMFTVRRGASIPARAAALGAACALVAASLACQSKGAFVGLAVSTVVVFAVVPKRLRLLPPVAVALVAGAAAFRPLTGPYRATTDAGIDHAARLVGVTVIAVAAAGALIGVLLALADRRLTVSRSTGRLAGILVTTALLAVLAAGAAVFIARHDHPGRYVEQKWQSFKHQSAGATGSSHLASLGSNRYDFWRVALDEFRAKPLAGIGSRGFYSAYLQHRRSPETPLRAHSLYLDVLAEDGVVGAALTAAGLGLLFATLGRRRHDLPAAAALGAGAYFLAHAGVDWMWTFPALGIPFFLIVGIGAAGGARRVPLRAALPGSAAALLLAALAFAPPFVAARFTTAAYADPGHATRDLRWARRLDPLSLDPLFARWRLAQTASQRVAALEEARRIEPTSIAVLYQLGLAQLTAGERQAAAATLRRALELDPRDAFIRQALALAGRSGK